MDKITFAVVVGDDVACTIVVSPPFSQQALLSIAAYRSDPQVVEVTGLHIKSGDTWDGTNFHPLSVGS